MTNFRSTRRRLTIAALVLPVLGGGFWWSLRAQSGKEHAGMTPWPFDQPRNSATLTMRQVLDRSKPILLVSHDEDDHGWQFIGPTDASVADGRVVALEEIAKLDPTVLEVADLEPGWQAVRDRLGAPWARRKRPAELDE